MKTRLSLDMSVYEMTSISSLKCYTRAGDMSLEVRGAVEAGTQCLEKLGLVLLSS